MPSIPTTGPITLTDIKNARNSDGTNGTTSNIYSFLRNGADFSKFDTNYLNGATTLSQINNFSQWRNYPINTLNVIQTNGIVWFGVSNNETTTNPIQLICGWNSGNDDGRVYRSTNYGTTYSSLLTIDQRLYRIKYLPNFRHGNYLTTLPFLAVGEGGRIICNTTTDTNNWTTISSPTTRDLFGISFNNTQAIIVGNGRILKSTTNNRINSWTVVNSNSNIWRDVTTNNSIFVAVGENSSIITGDSIGTTWTPRNMPPLTPTKDLYGVTYHNHDSYFYAVGRDISNNDPYIMRSQDGINWSTYLTSGDPINFGLYSIISINDKLYVGGTNSIYEIDNGVVKTFSGSFSGFVTRWISGIKNANDNGFDFVSSLSVGGDEFNASNGGTANY